MVAHIPDSSIRDLSEKSSAAQKIYNPLGNLRLPPGALSATSNITIAQTGVDETQRPTEAVTINSVTITKFE